MKTEAQKAAIAAQVRAHRQIPEVKAAIAAQVKAHNQQPEVKAATAARMKVYWLSPKGEAQKAVRICKARAACAALNDVYVGRKLRGSGWVGEVPTALIEVKRELILTKRAIKEMKKGVMT